MEFQKFTAGEVSYGQSNPAAFEYPPGVTNVNFEDDRVWDIIKNSSHPEHDAVNRFIECLGICHTVVSEEKKTKDGTAYKVYNASSPDELALVNGMRHFGFAFQDRDEEENIIIEKKFTGEVLKYKLLNVFEFNSDRKRMSVIVRTPDQRIMIVCKGADSIINARLQLG